MSTGYRPPSREPKGRWARHIHAVRRQKNWSATRAFEELLKAGLPLSDKSRSAYLKIESGERQPKPAEEPYLVQVYGYPPEDEATDATPPTDIAALVEALNRQTTAINGLVSRLESLADEAIREGVADALREAGLSPGAGGSPTGQPPGQFV